MADITSPAYTVVVDSQGADQYAIVRQGQLRKQTRSALIDKTTEAAENALRIGGTTSARPSAPEPYTMFFDDTLGHPIWWNGLVWVDSDGTVV
jgi:hypothetical protein